MKKVILILLACFSLIINSNACCSEPNFTLTELLVSKQDDYNVFICKVDSSWVSQRWDYGSFATVHEILIGENVQKKIKLGTGGNNSAGGKRLVVGEEYLIFSGTKDGYAFYAFQCDPFSAPLVEHEGGKIGRERLRLIRKILKLKNENFTGKVALQQKNGNGKSQTLGKGRFKNGKPDGLWRHYRSGNAKKTLAREINYKNGVLDGFRKKYFFWTEDALIQEVAMYEDGMMVSQNLFSIKNDSSIIQSEQKITKNWKGDTKKAIINYAEDGHISERFSTLNTKIGSIGHGFYSMHIRDGIFESFDKNGKLTETGEYRLGAKIGTWQYYDLDGKMRQEVYEPVDTLFAGFRVYHPNGIIKSEGEIVDDKAHGLWKSYFEDGMVNVQCQFIDGKIEGRKEIFNSDGHKQATTDYKDGEMHGKMTYYYPDGQISSFTNYENGKKEGAEKRFHKNGEIAYNGFYADGKEEGTFLYHSAEGEQYQIKNYKNGFLHGIYQAKDPKTGAFVEKGFYENGLKVGKWEQGATHQYFKRECFYGPLPPGDHLGNQRPDKCIQYDEEGNVLKEYKG